MKAHFFIAILMICILLNGCTYQKHKPTPKLHHALLVTPNKNAVSKAINILIHMQNVELAEDVFTTSSTVTLSNLNENSILESQKLNPPDQFELMIKDKKCFIRHLDSKATRELKNVQCIVNELH